MHARDGGRGDEARVGVDRPARRLTGMGGGDGVVSAAPPRAAPRRPAPLSSTRLAVAGGLTTTFRSSSSWLLDCKLQRAAGRRRNPASATTVRAAINPTSNQSAGLVPRALYSRSGSNLPDFRQEEGRELLTECKSSSSFPLDFKQQCPRVQCLTPLSSSSILLDSKLTTPVRTTGYSLLEVELPFPPVILPDQLL